MADAAHVLPARSPQRCLILSVPRKWIAALSQPYLAVDLLQDGRPLGISQRQSDRQTERQNNQSGGHHGQDVGKKLKRCKHYILADIEGNLVYAVNHIADIQDRDSARLLLVEIIMHFS